MKKQRTWIAYAAALASIAMLTGCSNIAESSTSQTPVEVQTIDETTMVSDETAQETQTESGTETEAASQEETQADSQGDSSITDTSSNGSDEIVGDTGLTASQWCTKAQSLYTNAASIYFTYLCSSDGFTYDSDDMLEDNWYRVTSCDTLEDASAAYFAIFAKSTHGSDLDGQFQVADDKLYRLCGDRGTDISYVSSQVTALTDSTSDTLTFTVTSTYADLDTGEETTQDDVFSLCDESGTWYVDQFTMPY